MHYKSFLSSKFVKISNADRSSSKQKPSNNGKILGGFYFSSQQSEKFCVDLLSWPNDFVHFRDTNFLEKG